MTSLYERISDYNNSITVKGISNTLLSSHSSTGPTTTVTQAINLYEKAFEKLRRMGQQLIWIAQISTYGNIQTVTYSHL